MRIFTPAQFWNITNLIIKWKQCNCNINNSNLHHYVKLLPQENICSKSDFKILLLREQNKGKS